MCSKPDVLQTRWLQTAAIRSRGRGIKLKAISFTLLSGRILRESSNHVMSVVFVDLRSYGGELEVTFHVAALCSLVATWLRCYVATWLRGHVATWLLVRGHVATWPRTL